MIPEYNRKEYIKRRLQGERVAYAASIYGAAAMTSQHVDSDFIVLVLDKDSLSHYTYCVKEGKFNINDINESISHNISNIIDTAMLQNVATRRWWEAIFFEKDGLCTYDPYYNTLKIAEGSDVTFETIIDDLISVIRTLPIPTSHTKLMFLTGELAKIPLIRYAFQRNTANGQVKILPEELCQQTFDENNMVLRPEEKLRRLSLNTLTAISFADIVDHDVNISIPLESLGNTMISNIKWEDILEDKQEDYRTSDIPFKNVNIHVEYDSLQNIFLVCNDQRGNTKTLIM